MFFALTLGGVLPALNAPDMVRNRWRHSREAAWYVVPLGLSLGFFVFALAFGTAYGMAQSGAANPYFHRAWPSLTATLQTLPKELLLHDGSQDGLSNTGALLSQVLLLAGFYGVASTGCFSRVPWRQQVALVLIERIIHCYP